MGPRASAGKNVKPPTTRMTPTTRPTNKPPVVGKVPDEAGMLFFSTSEPAIAMAGMIMRKRPTNIATPPVRLKNTVWARIAELRQRVRIDCRDRGPAEIHQRQHQDGQHGHLDFLGLDFFADIFRRAPDHEAGDENRDDDEQQHAVKAGTDTADNDLAELNVDQRDHAA